MKYIVKNCPACRQYQVGIYTCDDLYDCDLQRCQDCIDCVIKQVIEKLNEADNSCEGKNCSECSGFYICHSQFANKILQLFNIEEVSE